MFARSHHIPVNGSILKNKANEIAAAAGRNWRANEGWLHRWKKRHAVVYRTVCGERAEVDEEVTDE
jgi:hypothetical protein